jgi:uncharacterized repeat protein (TIGR03803 family)
MRADHLRCGLNNSAVGLELDSTKLAAAIRGTLMLAMFSVLFLISLQPTHAQTTETVLYSFGSQTGDGGYPYAGLIMDSKGNFYGTTSSFGANGTGGVFEFSPTGTETVLYNFPSGVFNYPFDYYFEGTLLMDKGNLYGTNYQGGDFPYGTVYELAKPAKKGEGWTESTLFNFGGDQGNETDGAVPYAGLIMDKEGNLYSTTNAGGVTSGGTIFELTPTSSGCPVDSYTDDTNWCDNQLYSFGYNPYTKGGGEDGIYPYGGVIMDKEGNLYGTAEAYGQYSGGAVWELSPVSATGACPGGSNPNYPLGNWCETVLYNFVTYSADGTNPFAGLIMDSKGNLYGTTFWGTNDYGPGSGYGSVFELGPVPATGICPAGSSAGNGWCETVIHTFGGSGDGSNPYAGLIRDSKGNLYGTTYNGGANGYGIVFELSPPTKKGGAWTETVLYSFCSLQSCADGGNPVAGLLRDKEGDLYGTTQYGGAYAEGTVFEVTP